jgi:hypothetical protein
MKNNFSSAAKQINNNNNNNEYKKKKKKKKKRKRKRKRHLGGTGPEFSTYKSFLNTALK